MKLFKKVVAGLLLSFGFLCVVILADELLDKDVTPEEKAEATEIEFAGVLFGVPSLVGGEWLLWNLYRQGQKEVRDRLNSTFYRLIQESNGQLTVLHFAMEAQLPGKAAKHYLDEKAKEFQAAFDVTETGDVIYHFHL